MVDSPEPSSTPTLDEWLSEVGETGVVAAIEALRVAVDTGAVPIVRDADALRAYWDARRRQRA